jgi:integrase/recombinase XerD
MSDVWSKFPGLLSNEQIHRYVVFRQRQQAPRNTLLAICNDLADYIAFCKAADINVLTASRFDVALYIEDMAKRKPGKRGRKADSPIGLSASTQHRRLETLRAFYDFAIDEGCRTDLNPAAKRQRSRSVRFVSQNPIRVPRSNPWIPTDPEWQRVALTLREETLRNQVMFALSYDSALRSCELLGLRLSDIDSALRLLRVRAEHSKSKKERTIPFSHETNQLLIAYQMTLPIETSDDASFFLSVSDRNCGDPIGIDAWKKVITKIRSRARLFKFHAHTLRHLGLTDLARGGMDIISLRDFAGHASVRTTQIYISLASTDIQAAYERSHLGIRTSRLQDLTEINVTPS